ncbi:RNA polymerase II-associated protein 1 [Asbolus verrucosus]|uniref:RNA polymerase II-associated protein 1 n=1 Tax=Asbolus verrucosus TaxID=1661398 RepID=A0A482VL34_ASBVE|nr:RNA polymerase II-associated protein 1 [Asbolus verrucosus]
MYSRPKPNETEEDLLRLQAEFNRQKSENKVKLAATVVSEKKDEKPETNEDVCMVDIQDQLANTFEAIPDHSNLGGIVEKTVETYPLPPLNFSKNKGFPTAKRRDVNSSNSQQGGSIFARQFKKFKSDKDQFSSNVNTTKISLPSQSFVLTGDEKGAIHQENVKKISSMTEQEILEEREHLLTTMDPAIIAFLRSRRSKHDASSSRNPTIQEQNEAAQDVDIEQIETPNEILSQPNSDKWLNFRSVETSKLAWMRSVDKPKIEKNQSFEARFDFEGWLLPYSENEISEKSRILYHHGEEAGRPGYTLQELFQLARSNVIQQKIIALNTIANILSLQLTGVYDGVIDLPIEQIFFVVRFCLDDNTPGVLNGSIKAMRNLFYSKIDETCLDCLLGFGLGQVQPVLGIDNELEDDNTVNDQQLAETNLVKCLARTEILVRIRYIINTVKPSIETIVYSMDILTRLVRDSQFIMTKVYNCENLIKSIINNFVPASISQNSADPNSPYGLPLLQALKLLRILATRSQTIATDLVGKYQIMDAILSYLSSEKYSLNTNGLKLQTESLHLWSVFVHYGIALDYFQVLNPVLMEMLNYHFKNTNFTMTTTFVRQGHVSALLVLLGGCRNLQLVSPYVALLQNCLIKWFAQFMTISEFACGKLQIVSSLFYCLASLHKMMKIPDEINKLVLELLNSGGFEIVTKTVKNGSMLLNNYEPHKSSPNLKTVEAAAWFASEHVVPLVQTNSPIPFLSSLSNFVATSDDDKIKLAFLRHSNVREYLEMLRKLDKYFLSNNWFARVESNLIMNILKISITVRTDVDTCPFYEVAVKCLSVFNSDQKPDIEHILANIIFSSSFYPSDVLMNSLTIEQKHDCLETSLNNLNEILTVYTQVLGLKVDVPNYTTNLCLDLDVGNVIPIDWIYTPIIVLYSNQQQNKQNLDESRQVFIIRNCLRWVLIYETYFPDLAATINPTDRFCRIACVFLGSDNLFLISEIHNLLQLCLNNIIQKCGDAINFNKEIQGLNNFQDFYTQLLEQYQGVSYGDVLFGNFILVPLAQRHALKWRKTLWSEYAGVVEIFNVTSEQSVCPLHSFLTPNEDDLSLLKCYRRALVNNAVRKHSILYQIAKYHVEQYVLKKKNKD